MRRLRRRSRLYHQLRPRKRHLIIGTGAQRAFPDGVCANVLSDGASEQAAKDCLGVATYKSAVRISQRGVRVTKNLTLRIGGYGKWRRQDRETVAHVGDVVVVEPCSNGVARHDGVRRAGNRRGRGSTGARLGDARDRVRAVQGCPAVERKRAVEYHLFAVLLGGAGYGKPERRLLRRRDFYNIGSSGVLRVARLAVTDGAVAGTTRHRNGRGVRAGARARARRGNGDRQPGVR